MADPRTDRTQREEGPPDDWGYEGARRFALELALQMTPAQRLHWLEQTMHEMRSLCGLASPERCRKPRPPR